MNEQGRDSESGCQSKPDLFDNCDITTSINMDGDPRLVTALSLDHTVERQSDTSEIVQLDPEGDATLIINGSGYSKRYLVCSRVLSLASPVFSKLFGPNFKEGQQTRRGDCPCISLEEDDTEAMGLMLGILHYKCAQVPFALDPTALATVAIHVDKYDCNEALRPWAAHWCSNSEDITAPQDLGFMLLAAYMFRSSSFTKITATAVKQLTPGFASAWGGHEALALLPEAVTGLGILPRLQTTD